MKYLMSRFGGHAFIIGEGKASAKKLPEDQSLDNMLDEYATEIIPNHFFISSYDAVPEWMGSYPTLKGTKAIKIGTLTHRFNEIFLQHELEVCTEIYVANHCWSNVFALLIKTSNDLSLFFENYQPTYDYVLQVFIRSEEAEKDQKLSKNPSYIEKILLILFYKMNLTNEGDIIDFRPSGTVLGKKISQTFVQQTILKLSGIDSDEQLAEILLTL